MIFHAKSVLPPANIVIRTVDTEVLIITLGCVHTFNQDISISMETGVYTKNTLRYLQSKKPENKVNLEKNGMKPNLVPLEAQF